MRLITRNDASLSAALIAAAVILFQQPLRYVLDATRDIESRFHLDLVPALLLLVVTFTFHEYRKRVQAREEAITAAADAAQARAQSRTLQKLIAFGHALANADDRAGLQQVLWQQLPAFAGQCRFWALVRRRDQWEPLLQDQIGDPRSIEQLRDLATRTIQGIGPDHQHVFVREGDDTCFPMVAGGAVVGVLGVTATAPLTEEHASAIGAAATVMAIGVKHMQLLTDARDSSLRDALTGCFNRAYALQTLDTEVHRVRRTGLPLSVVMFDVDHFKAVNDRFGHLCGDELLASVGAQLSRSMRSTDVRCRYAGDEFLIILPDTPAAGALQVAESLRQSVGRLIVASAPGHPPITISVGVAEVGADETDAKSFLRRADEALYRAKRGGRNRVCVASMPASLAVVRPFPTADAAAALDGTTPPPAQAKLQPMVRVS
jgi:diguanylate cyclase (GGDEF)-like protein